MIKSLNVSDARQANEHTKHASCGLHVNVWNFLFMAFCFIMKKIILSKSCYFGLRSPLNHFLHMKRIGVLWALPKRLFCIMLLIIGCSLQQGLLTQRQIKGEFYNSKNISIIFFTCVIYYKSLEWSTVCLISFP